MSVPLHISDAEHWQAHAACSGSGTRTEFRDGALQRVRCSCSGGSVRKRPVPGTEPEPDPHPRPPTDPLSPFERRAAYERGIERAHEVRRALLDAIESSRALSSSQKYAARLVVEHADVTSTATYDQLETIRADWAGVVHPDDTLMTAFDAFPTVEAPTGPVAVPGRVFELRTYESHNETAGLKKIEMFEKGGELPIFARVGVTPVFFGRNTVGPRLPSLTYMLVFPDLATREKNWGVFRDDPEWVKLRSTPGHSNAEILTNIHVQILRATDYSQV